MSLTLDQYSGCILGLATGDALGAPHEGGLVERLVWRLIGRTWEGRLRWTDDTQMALDLAESLLQDNDILSGSLAQRFAASYRWSRGYGPGAAKVLKRIRRGESWESAATSVYAGGSYGNGAAMRAPVLALFYPHDQQRLIAAAQASARITHAHPAGIEGAVVMAIAAQSLLQRRTTSQVLQSIRDHCAMPEFAVRMKTATSWIESNANPSPREVSAELGNGITAPISCPTSIYIALRHRDSGFESMMDFIIQCGGDVDTIGAMAGALWGIANGAGRLPRIRLEASETLVEVAQRLFDHEGCGKASVEP